MFNRLIYIGLLMYVMPQPCFVCFFCLLSSPLFVFLSLSILLASTDGVDTPSGNLSLYFSLCYMLLFIILANKFSLSLS